MRRLFVLIVACICGLMLFASCSKSPLHSSDNTNPSPADDLRESSSSVEKTNQSNMNYNEEKKMEKVLRSLVNNNYDCITQLFYYGHLPYNADSIDEVNHTAIVDSKKFATLNDIKQYLSTFYVDKEVDRLLNDYFESNPLYFEENGFLRINLDQASNAGIPVEWKNFTVESINVDGDTCSFSVKVEYDIDELYVGDPVATYEFNAVNNDGWKLVKAVYKP